MSRFQKITLWGLLIILVFKKSQGNKYRTNLDKYTKAFQYQTNEIELHFPTNTIRTSAQENNSLSVENPRDETLLSTETNKYVFMNLAGEEFLCDFGGPDNQSDFTYLGGSLEWEKMGKNLKDYIKESKISWLMERCFIFTKEKGINSNFHAQIDFYEVCVGISIRYKKQIIDKETSTSLLDGQFNTLGDYIQNGDFLSENGTIVQYYNPASETLKGDSGYSASIEFNCSYNQSGIVNVEDEIGNDFKTRVKVVFVSPTFCDWRVDEGRNITSLDKIERLLLPLENKCQNFTDSQFWNYELCNFYGVSQFKKDLPKQELKIFLLGIHPIAHLVFNHTDKLDHYLANSLLSNLVNEANPTGASLLRNITVTIEPRNRNEISQDNIHVQSKYVLIFQLGNGTFCSEENKQREIKLVFECPDNFATMSTYFRIANVVENSTCSYEMLILTPVICSHPLLMPLPVLKKKNTKCFSRKIGQKAKSHLTKTNNLEDKTLVGTNYGSSQFEAVPPEFIGPQISPNNTHLFFAYSASPRLRSKDSDSPHFYIGEIIQHIWWNYYGVIVGWDPILSAPDNWVSRVYQKYPTESKNKPHYLILVHQREVIFEGDSPIVKIDTNFTHSYIPEVALKSLVIQPKNTFADKNIINNPYLRRYFSHWSEFQKRFIPYSNSTLWNLYPEDFNRSNARDEL
ncbi:hemimethylated DNA binding domain-containing protein [Cryptosporidium felis]|nr:hemimethylated DNA binding domain-containing protein [Cryptosporidium felis]